MREVVASRAEAEIPASRSIRYQRSVLNARKGAVKVSATIKYPRSAVPAARRTRVGSALYTTNTARATVNAARTNLLRAQRRTIVTHKDTDCHNGAKTGYGTL